MLMSNEFRFCHKTNIHLPSSGITCGLSLWVLTSGSIYLDIDWTSDTLMLPEGISPQRIPELQIVSRIKYSL